MSYKQRLLLIEDEEDIASLVRLQAQASGYRLHVESDGINGFKSIEKEKPDLVLLDITLPGLSGLDLCKKMKSSPLLRKIPLILLNRAAEELDIILGLEMGADDYILKPFSSAVLFARIKAILRRYRTQEKPLRVVNFGPFTLEIDRHLLLKENQRIALTPAEFGILRYLLTHKGKPLSRNDLLNECHTADPFIIDRNIDVHVASLRKKLGEAHPYIKTIRGIGYQFCDRALPSSKKQFSPLKI